MKNVRLPGGSEVSLVVYTSVTLILKRLFDQDPDLIYELREICRDPDYKLSEKAHRMLIRPGLLDEDYYINRDVKAIILAVAQGEGLELHLVDP